MPIIASRASAAYGAGFAAITAAPFAATGAMEPIAVTTVPSGGVVSISFGSIPSTYQHLQIRLFARSTANTGTQNVTMSINGGSGSTWHRMFSNGTSTGANAQISAAVIIGQISGLTATSGVFGVATIDLLDYANTNKFKTARALFGFNDNNAGAGEVVQLFSGLWQTTSATTSITLEAGAGFAQYTSAALYGIKG
jgi:hypothetical protein